MDRELHVLSDFRSDVDGAARRLVALSRRGTLFAEGRTVPEMQQAVANAYRGLSARAGGHRDLERL